MREDSVLNYTLRFPNLTLFSIVAAPNSSWSTVCRTLGLKRMRIVTPLDIDSGDTSYIASFIRENGSSIITPLTFGNYLFGYLFRSIASRAFSVLTTSQLYFYSSDKFSEASRYKNFKYGDPLLVSEGVMDAELLSSVYYASIACGTNHISDAQAQYLSMFTNKVIYVPDNDWPGENGSFITKKNCSNHGIDIQIIKIPSKYKDPGEILESLCRLVISGNSESLDSVVSDVELLRLTFSVSTGIQV